LERNRISMEWKRIFWMKKMAYPIARICTRTKWTDEVIRTYNYWLRPVSFQAAAE
jgi:hypothetical protein